MKDEIPTKLRDRARLTVETYGWGELGLRVLTAPLRVLKLDKSIRDRLRERRELKATLLWYMTEGRPVTIVMPTYGDAGRDLRLGQVRCAAPWTPSGCGSWWWTTPAPPSTRSA